MRPPVAFRSSRSVAATLRDPGNALTPPQPHIRLVLPPLRGLTDTELIDEASRLAGYGAAVFVQTVPEEPRFMLYGPGFRVEITRTDSSADYPGRPV